MRTGKEADAGDLRLRVDEDILFVQPIGSLSIEHAQSLLRASERVKAQHGHLFLMVDLKRAGLLPAESRKLLARFGAENPPLAVAIYHVSPLVRGVNALLFGAINLLSKQRLNVMQFSSEQDAAEWIEAERKRLIPKADADRDSP